MSPPPQDVGQLINTPQAREIVHDFHSSRYASCLAALETVRRDASPATCRPPRPRHVRDTSTPRPRRQDLLLDLHLRPHVEQLYADIRSKALFS